MAEPVRILLEDADGRKRAVPFTAPELTVGRAPDSGLLLPERDVSRRHARLQRSNGAVWVEDLGSANGTRVNGERIEARRRIGPGDLVQIGSFDLAIEGVDADGAADAAPAPPPLPGAPPPPEPSAVARLHPALALSAARAAPPWRPVALLAAVALAAVALGYGAGKVLRAPPAGAERAAR